MMISPLIKPTLHPQEIGFFCLPWSWGPTPGCSNGVVSNSFPPGPYSYIRVTHFRAHVSILVLLTFSPPLTPSSSRAPLSPDPHSPYDSSFTLPADLSVPPSLLAPTDLLLCTSILSHYRLVCLLLSCCLSPLFSPASQGMASPV